MHGYHVMTLRTHHSHITSILFSCPVLKLLGTGYFHSDPHPGNLLKTPSGDLAYLDFGMMSEVPAARRFALIGTVLGLINKDIPLVIGMCIVYM